MFHRKHRLFAPPKKPSMLKFTETLLLESLFHELNQQHFGGELPTPKLKWNSRLSSSAGRFSPGSRNPLFPRMPEIEVATYLRDLPDGEFHIRDTILHEMVHYILWHRRQPYGHTAEFHRILKRVGARRYNPVPKERKYKHWYQCPGCKVLVPARRRLRSSACAPCCKKHNQGRYSEKFKLLPVPAPAAQTPPSVPVASAENSAAITPSEIVRRLEELKKMVMRA